MNIYIYIYVYVYVYVFVYRNQFNSTIQFTINDSIQFGDSI